MSPALSVARHCSTSGMSSTPYSPGSAADASLSSSTMIRPARPCTTCSAVVPSACGWYQRVLASSRISKVGDQVSPAAKALCGPPSMSAGMCAPWKWTLVSASRSLVMSSRTVEPVVHFMVGPR